MAALLTAGTLGTENRDEEGRSLVRAWFAEPPLTSGLPVAAGEERHGVTLCDQGWQEAEDWLASYRSTVQPLRAGCFVLDPREPGQPPPPVPPGCHLLRLPARTAFGTGSHVSTRLALAWIEELVRPGAEVLDVGCGSGVLALATALLGGRPLGFDLDPAAALTAGQYARLNGVAGAAGRFFAGGVEALARRKRFDLVVVNVLPRLVLPQAGELAERVRPGGSLVASGLLAEESSAVRRVWEATGLAAAAERGEEEWSSWRLKRPS